MRQTNLKNVACADVLFIIAVCKENTHTHATRAFKRSKKKKECMGRHITIKLLYTGQDVTRQRVTGRMILFPHRLVFWCHKLPLSQTLLSYAENFISSANQRRNFSFSFDKKR